MIEIARVEPKKIQRKLLTIEQKLEICNTPQNCDGCPLRFKALGFDLCESDVKALEIAIKHYWDEEVEVDLDDSSSM